MANILLRAIGVLAIVFIANSLFGLVQEGKDNTLLLGLGALAIAFADKIVSLLNTGDNNSSKKKKKGTRR